MRELNSGHEPNTTPPPTAFQPRLLPLLQKLKTAYLLWFGYYQTLPKTTRYSLGQRIDTLFIETIEAVSTASFLPKDEKRTFIRLAIRKLDTAKILLMVLWETKALPTKQYAALATPLEEIGKMLGGWQGQLNKNSPVKHTREK